MVNLQSLKTPRWCYSVTSADECANNYVTWMDGAQLMYSPCSYDGARCSARQTLAYTCPVFCEGPDLQELDEWCFSNPDRSSDQELCIAHRVTWWEDGSHYTGRCMFDPAQGTCSVNDLHEPACAP